MNTYTITLGNGTVLTQGSTTAGQTLGQILEESCSIDANLLVFALPFSDSSDTDVQDFGGVTNTTTIQGILTDTPANLATSWAALRSLINGDQSSDNNYPLSYVSDIQGTIKMKFHTITFTYLAGIPRKLGYSIKMVESSNNG